MAFSKKIGRNKINKRALMVAAIVKAKVPGFALVDGWKDATVEKKYKKLLADEAAQEEKGSD